MIAQAQFTIADLSDATAEVIVGTQTAATNAWTGKASFDELKDGQTILYWLPFAGTSTAATLNLTLANGTTQFMYKTTSSLTLEPGKEYIYAVTLKRTGIVLGTTITNWATPVSSSLEAYQD